MKFVNLTPHPIRVYRGTEVIRTFEPSGQVARLIDPQGAGREAQPIDGIPAAVPTPLEQRQLVGLPEPTAGTVYLVSVLCLAWARERGRYDVAAPDTDTGVVRDAQGRILGTTRLLLAGDEPPAYRVLTGSSTHAAPSHEPRDTDVLAWGDAPPDVAAVIPGRPLDITEIEPRLIDGRWVVRVPVWGDEDPARPQLLWHAPSAREVVVEREVQTTGPAQLRRWAATGIEPQWHEGLHTWVVEISAAHDLDRVYQGAGLLAWRSAFERVAAAGLTSEMPAHMVEFSEALLECDRADLINVGRRAQELARFPHALPGIPSMAVVQDVGGSPAAGGTVSLIWDRTHGSWRSAYAAHTSGPLPEGRTFRRVLRDWGLLPS